MISYDELIRERRMILKSLGVEHEEYGSHQRKGVPPPPLEKPWPESGILVDLVRPSAMHIGNMPLAKVISQRQSRRKFTNQALTLDELSFLLWSTQGVRAIEKNKIWTRRTVPSGGARHPYETYLIVNRVSGIEPGVYRYLAIEHKLLLVNSKPALPNQVSDACWGQSFVARPRLSSYGLQFPTVLNGATV